MSPTLATLRNMMRFEELHPRTSPNVEPVRTAMLDPDTGETFSATPGDYFAARQNENEPFTNESGTEMLLVVETHGFLDALSGEAI